MKKWQIRRESWLETRAIFLLEAVGDEAITTRLRRSARNDNGFHTKRD
jgi:hypothetical protein